MKERRALGQRSSLLSSVQMIAASRKTFNTNKVNDRIKLIEGPAGESYDELQLLLRPR
jgi:hypothetical protein